MSNKRQKGSRPKRQASQGEGSSNAPQHRPGGGESRKTRLVNIATTTLQAIEEGSYEIDGVVYPLTETVEKMKEGTILYSADSDLSGWSSHGQDLEAPIETEGGDGKPPVVEISVVEISALEGAQTLCETVKNSSSDNKRVGLLNFASAKNPGGGFLKGAQAQEESIARSSTVYLSFMTETAQRFYRSHRKDPKQGYYSHAMIYTPRALLLRTDAGEWTPPIEVDMVTSCAVNAGVARRQIHDGDESRIESTMKERMGRILYVFERQGVKNLVLGSFGTGVFRNKVESVSRIWLELLVGEDARFRHSFDRVVFAILGHETYLTFKSTFDPQPPGTTVTIDDTT